ncbi:MAG: hypothetical protein PHE73_06140 [Sulfurovaceae bacterium]|nr:hypothetical protein [Sulfurovaceae bacterium]
MLIIAMVFANANENVYSEVKSIISQMESSGKHDIVNRNGFLGKYQFGAMSLVDIGLLKLENYKALTYTMETKTRAAKVMWKNGYNLTKFLDDPSNWNIEGGKQAFLNNVDLQDKAMDTMLKLNTKRLLQKGFDLSNPSFAKSMLIASHFGGVGSAEKYAREHKDYRDDFGTSISKYYKAGS